jgi:hypothetical protein
MGIKILYAAPLHRHKVYNGAVKLTQVSHSFSPCLFSSANAE